MRATKAEGVRFCDHCKQNVHWANDAAEYNVHVREGRCIAFDTPLYAVAGMPDGILTEYALVMLDESLTPAQLSNIRKSLHPHWPYSDIKKAYLKGSVIIEGLDIEKAKELKAYYDSIGIRVDLKES